MEEQFIKMKNIERAEGDEDDIYKTTTITKTLPQLSPSTTAPPTPPLLNRLEIAFAEFLGTAFLVYFECLGCAKFAANPLAQSIGNGLVIMTVIQIFGHISGSHVNPAVTVAAFIMRQINARMALVYFIAQIAGAITGYAFVLALTPKNWMEAGHCITSPHVELSQIQALFVEIFATLTLCLAICAVWDVRNAKNTDSVSLRIGLVVTMLCIFVGPYSGASLNPARSVGPAIWNKTIENHWIYWLGPITGGILAGYIYRAIFSGRNTRQ